MPGQFDHGEVSTAQGLVQVIQPGYLPVMMAFERRHGSGGVGGGVAFCCLLVSGQFFISSSVGGSSMRFGVVVWLTLDQLGVWQ